MTVAFNNPSNITITIGDLTFDSIWKEKGDSIGQVFMKDIVIKPGNNTFDCMMHMMNKNHKDYIDDIVSIYMTNSHAPLTISGTPESTAIKSIQDALSTVRLDTIMAGIDSHLVERTDVTAKVAVIFTHKAETTVTLNNPLGTPYTVTKVEAEIVNPNDGKPYKMGSIDYELPDPVTVPPGGQVKTDSWPVDIDANALELLGLLGNGEISIDITQNVTVKVGETDGGYPSYFYYYQNNVPCGLDIKLLGMSLPTDEDGKKKDDGNSTGDAVSSAASAATSAGGAVASGVSDTVDSLTGGDSSKDDSSKGTSDSSKDTSDSSKDSSSDSSSGSSDSASS